MRRGEFSLESIIRTLGTYSLIHKSIIGLNTSEHKPVYGMTVYADRTMYIDPKAQGMTEKYDTICHEILHSSSDLFGWNLTEEEVKKLTARYFKKIFKYT